MAPGSTAHHIFSLTLLLHCTFRLHISLCNQSWRDSQPLYSVGCKFICFCAGTLETCLDTPTGLIPWFSNWGKYLLLLCCITLSSSREKSTRAQEVAEKKFGAVAGEVLHLAYQVPIINSSTSHYIICHSPLIFLSPTSKTIFENLCLFFTPFPFVSSRLLLVCLCVGLIVCHDGSR